MLTSASQSSSFDDATRAALVTEADRFALPGIGHKAMKQVAALEASIAELCGTVST
jgi:hypothetical protein